MERMRGAILLALSLACLPAAEIDSQVQHGYADSSGVKIHYATIGSGPLLVMIHGFPDFWYSWRHQMPELAKTHQVVAIDQRGYNESDKPKGQENYDIKLLVADVVAVVRHFKRDKAVIAGHDWGGAVAWSVAMYAPEVVEKLIVLNLPHPRGLARELANNPAQQANSEYARKFQEDGAHKALTPESLAGWVTDSAARAKYVEALKRSDFEAMLHYYKQNYPRAPYREPAMPPPRVKAPVLLIHGLKDRYLLAGALNGTWEWVDNDLTLVTIPYAGHFVQQDAADLVTRAIAAWLKR